jgi:hypothetical protein
MKNIKLALKYFGLAYLIATILGFSTYYIINVIAMWVVMFTIMPIIFGYFFYRYLKNTAGSNSNMFQETNILIVFWIVSSFLLDGFVYIAFVPIIYGYRPNWTFFIDQSPWIWLNYCTIIILGHSSRYFYIRKARNKSVS